MKPTRSLIEHLRRTDPNFRLASAAYDKVFKVAKRVSQRATNAASRVFIMVYEYHWNKERS